MGNAGGIVIRLKIYRISASLKISKKNKKVGIYTYMKLKDLNKLKNTYINTGYCVYIGSEEVWKKGFYNGKKTEFYISNFGRVWNTKKDKLQNIFESIDGYLYVQSYYIGYRTSIQVSKLVLESFEGEPPENMENPEVDHINTNTHDNSLKNLRYLSREDNLARRTLKNQEGSNNSNNKYSEEFILRIADELSSNEKTVSEIAKEFNVPKTTVNNVKYKIRWKKLLKDYDFIGVPDSKPSHHNTYTSDQVLHVAKLLTENNLTMKEISNITGVRYDTISLIKNKKIYKDLLEPFDFSKFKGKNVLPKELLPSIDGLIQEGKNPKNIAENLNVEYTTKFRNGIYERKRKLKINK